jgi:hypothetical protein
MFSFAQFRMSGARWGPCATVMKPRGEFVKCGTCGVGLRKSPLAGSTCYAEGEGARLWPDYPAGNETVACERVVEEITAAGLTGFKAHPLPFSKIDSPTLRALPGPRYYVIEITGRLDLDRWWFDEYEGHYCPECHRWGPSEGDDRKYSWGNIRLMPDMRTWTGDDFAMCSNILVGYRFCTPKVVDLARAMRWEGIQFSGLVPYGPRLPLEHADWLARYRAEALEKNPDFFKAGKP